MPSVLGENAFLNLFKDPIDYFSSPINYIIIPNLISKMTAIVFVNIFWNFVDFSIRFFTLLHRFVMGRNSTISNEGEGSSRKRRKTEKTVPFTVSTNMFFYSLFLHVIHICLISKVVIFLHSIWFLKLSCCLFFTGV